MSRCPWEDRIDGYLLNKLDEAAAAEFEEHYFNCPACFAAMTERAEIIGVLKHGDVFAPGTEAQRVKPSLEERLFGFLTPRRLAAVGAAAALVIAAVLILTPRGGVGESPLVISGDETLRGESIVLIAPPAEALAAPGALEWGRLAKAADYEVVLSEGETVLWRGTSEAARLELPADVRASLAPGRSYSWQVKAFAADGTLLAVSPWSAFRIVPGR